MKNKLKLNLLLFLLIGSLTVQANLLDKQFRRVFSENNFVAPTHLQLQTFQAQFKRALEESSSKTVWQDLAWQQSITAPFVFLSEQETEQQGGGFIILRQGVARPWMLQSPHAKSDLYTGKIATRLFAEGLFKVGLWNSVPRKKVDVAHHYQSYWQVVTQVFEESYPNGRIIQLHGFNAKKRKRNVAKNADMIISAGHRFPPLWVQNVASCLTEQLGINALLYPYEVTELGATTNSQGQLLQSLGHQGFLHLEMNKKLRKDLLNDAELREKLLACLLIDE